MADDDILDALKKLRADLITALARMETEITTLEYAVLDKGPVTAARLEQLKESVKSDDRLQQELRGALERTIRRIP